jgi:6-phosphofructokinase
VTICRSSAPRLPHALRPPDSLDRLVAKNFAALAAADLILAGKTGRLVSIQGGRYTTEPLEIVGEGKKQVDVERFYDREKYRPNIVGVMGLPMFLC